MGELHRRVRPSIDPRNENNQACFSLVILVPWLVRRRAVFAENHRRWTFIVPKRHLFDIILGAYDKQCKPLFHKLSNSCFDPLLDALKNLLLVSAVHKLYKWF